VGQHRWGSDELDRCRNCVATCLCLLSHRRAQGTRVRWKQDIRWTGCRTDDCLRVEKQSSHPNSGFGGSVNKGLYAREARFGLY